MFVCVHVASVMYFIFAAVCQDLPVPLNGRINYSPTGAPILLDTVASYSCDEGYVISGGTERVCGSSGDWSGEEITCQCE